MPEVRPEGKALCEMTLIAILLLVCRPEIMHKKTIDSEDVPLLFDLSAAPGSWLPSAHFEQLQNTLISIISPNAQLYLIYLYFFTDIC